jgi:diacylglycerol kinase family enzyme
MRLRLIANPVATGTSPAVVAAVRAELARVAPVETALTERAGHAWELAGEVADGGVVALGGDGTANEVVNGVRAGVPVGLLPAGASSIFARQLGLGSNPVGAARLVADAIAEGRTRPIGLGEVNGRRFTFPAGMGLDAEVVREVDLRRALDPTGRRPPDVQFVAATVRVLRRHGWRLADIMQLDAADGWSLRCSYLAIANAHPYTYLGRLPVRAAPRARFERGLDVVAAGHLRARDLWRLPVYGLVWPRHAGPRGDTRVAYLHDLDAFTVRSAAPVALQADGEYLGEVKEARYRSLPAAVRVFAPVRATTSRPPRRRRLRR